MAAGKINCGEWDSARAHWSFPLDPHGKASVKRTIGSSDSDTGEFGHFQCTSKSIKWLYGLNGIRFPCPKWSLLWTGKDWWSGVQTTSHECSIHSSSAPLPSLSASNKQPHRKRTRIHQRAPNSSQQTNQLPTATSVQCLPKFWSFRSPSCRPNDQLVWANDTSRNFQVKRRETSYSHKK